MSTPVPATAPAESPWTQMLVGRLTGATADAPVRNKEALEEVSPAQVKAAVDEVNVSLQSRSIGVQFEVDHDTDKLIVKVIDRLSGEVIRQIPNEEVVRLAKVMGDAPGMLVDHTA